jgi:hypothetical protein
MQIIRLREYLGWEIKTGRIETDYSPSDRRMRYDHIHNRSHRLIQHTYQFTALAGSYYICSFC